MNFIQEMGIKDLEHVVLKAKEEVELGGHLYEAGEPILYFRNIQIAMLSENTRVIAARGGFLNQPRVVWEDRSDVTFQFSNGTLNPISLNMLLEANMLRPSTIYVPMQEVVDIDSYGNAFLTQEPAPDKKSFFKLFSLENLQTKVMPLSMDGRKITFDKKYGDQSVVADYYFIPKNSPITYTMDRERKANLYTLEATFYLKDENDGLLHTGILEMPKVYIMSNINLRMGERADPTVGTFRIVAMPETVDSYEAMVCRVTYLDEDIYGI